MANIGLTVRDNPDLGGSLSLANTLAGAIFGDPEQLMKARLYASEVTARNAAAAKDAGDLGLVQEKTREQKMRDDAAAAAAGPAGDAYAAAVPMPVPVEAPRPDAGTFGSYGPQPAIVRPEDRSSYNAQVRAARALGPLIVTTPGNPSELAQGFSRGLGTFGVVGQPDPNRARTYGGLAVDAQPSVTSVQTQGDFAGVDAAARKEIAVDAAKPPEPKMFGDQPYTVRLGPDGQPVLAPTPGFQPQPVYRDSNGGIVAMGQGPDGRPVATPVVGAEPQPKAPERQLVDGVVYERGPDGKWSPAQGIAPSAPPKQETQTVDGVVYAVQRDPVSNKVTGMTPVPGVQAPTPPKQEIQVVNDVPMAVERDPATNKIIRLTPIEGTPDKAPEPLYPGKTDKAAALNRIAQIQQKLANHLPISAQEADLYGSDFNAAYGPTNTKTVDPGTGKPLSFSVSPSVPQGTPSVNDVRAAANLPAFPVVSQDDKFTPKAATQEQAQLQQYTPQLVASTTKLDKVPPAQIPGVFIQKITGVGGDDPNFIQQLLASTPFVSSQQRNFAQAVAEYNQSLLYMLSGKAITADEYKRAMRSYIPLPGDDATQLAIKAEQRHTIIASAVRLGWGSDPDTAKKVAANVKARTGIDLAPLDLTGTLGDVAAPDGKPPIGSFFK